MRYEAVAGALIGTMVGDALGARWEGSATADGRDGGPRIERSLAATTLTYTDDTQLTLALARHLLDHPDIDPEALREEFLADYEPWRGYGAGMHAVVDAWERGMSTDEAARVSFPEGSLGNGAAMRVAPVAVRHVDARRRDTAAARQARVTHVHPLGVDSAILQARAVGAAADAGTFDSAQLHGLADGLSEPLPRRLSAAVETVDSWRRGDVGLRDVATRLGTGVVGPDSVPAALWAAAAGTDAADVVTIAVGLGGDADTIAAMAGAIAGAADGVDAFPPDWLDALENGRRGRDHALDLARRLVEAAPGQSR